MVLTQPPAEPATTTVTGTDAPADDRAVPAPEKAAPGLGPDGVRKLGYVPALDGIRGVAVVAVLLFHGGVKWAKGGFLGVDVFFVLSGFLITTLLLEELAEHQTIHLRQFWTRRARRLLPALIVVVVATALVPKLVSLDRSVADLRRDAAAALAYFANWRFVINGSSYFGRTAAPSPLKHTWSLAVEEQFYVAWPLIVLLVARARRWWLTVVALLGAAASAVAMGVLFHPGGDPSRVYYGTDTHVQVVLLGALLATLMMWRRLRPGRAILWTRPGRFGLALVGIGGAAIVGAILMRANGSATWLYRGGFAGLGLATCVVIAAVVLSPAGLLAGLFSLWPLRALGRISYGIYLWHWPLFFVITRTRTGLSGSELLWARLAASVAVAMVSAWIIERPIRIGQLLPGWRAGIVLPALAAAGAAALFATTVIPHGQSLLAAALAEPPEAKAPASGPGSAATAAALAVSKRPPRVPGAPLHVLVMGDSVALTLAQGLAPQAGRAGIDLSNEAVLGCGVVRGGPFRYFGDTSMPPKQCATWPQQWANAIKRHDPDVVMVVVGRWEVMDRMYNGHWTRLGDPDFDAYLMTELNQAVDILTTKGAVVAFATAPYYFRGERPDGGRWPEDDPARVDRFNQLLEQVVAKRSKQATIISLGDHTSTGGKYTRSLDGIQLRYDGVHFTPAAGKWLSPWLFPQLLAVGPPSTGGAPVGAGSSPSTTIAGRNRTTSTSTTSTTSTTVRSSSRTRSTTPGKYTIAPNRNF